MDKKRSNPALCMRLIRLVRPLAGFMVLAVCMGVAGNLCAVFIPVLGTRGVLEVLGTVRIWDLKWIFVLLILLAVSRGFLRYGEQTCNHFIAFKLLALIRDKVFKALRRLCPAKLEGKEKGNLISVITSDIELLEVFYAHTISPILIAFFMSLIMCLFIGHYHPGLGIFAAGAYLVVGVVIPVLISGMSRDYGAILRKQTGELSSYVLDSLRGLEENIQYRMEEKRLEEMDARADALSVQESRLKKTAGRNTALTNTAVLALDLGMLFLAAALYMRHAVSFEGAVTAAVALMSSFGPVIALANLGSTLQQTFAAGNRVMDLLDEEPATEEIAGQPETDFDGTKAEHITFGYGEDIILSDFSVEIPKNRIIGIKGRSGSGKSTFLKLMMRFWETQKGQILISDRNINGINTGNLRQMESFVTQETHLFHDSIENNIRIAKLDATREEIEKACRMASIHEFICSLPKGYDTPVGELGDTLSGGEKQRIALARSFLHDAPLILLDEPTSNLDSLNEGAVLKALDEEKEGKTMILVSHRESTMGIADQVYAVENGRMS